MKMVMPMSKEKMFINGTFATLEPSDGIRSIAHQLNHAIAKEESGEWRNIYIHSLASFDCEEWHIVGQRLETDHEHKARLKREEQAKKSAERQRKARENSERKEYERLKKKFEKDNTAC